MSNTPLDLDEIQMLLGLKNKQDQIFQILSDKQNLPLLSAISEILSKFFNNMGF